MSETDEHRRIGGKQVEAPRLQTRSSGASLVPLPEIRKAIRALKPADFLRLHKVARALCRGAAFEADDLLQEAFHRALDGTRHCPRHVEVVQFLVGAMRSIASDWSKARRRRPEMSLVTSAGDLREVIVQVCDSRPDAHEQLASDQEEACLRTAVCNLFSDDAVARRMVEGIMDGAQGAELRALTGLNETEFASKRRLVRRRIDRAFPKEWKS